MGNLVSMGNLQFFSFRNSSSTPSTTSSSSTPSSSITAQRKKYDVFLSFRGEDTRNGFISHLYDALNRRQIETFIDNQLTKGNEISSNLLRAINESKIAVIIFSKDYASSKWCLRELTEIMKHCKQNGQIVMPIFYDVDSSDVRKQTGTFKESFAKHIKENQEEVQKWKEALTGASNLSGWDSSEVRPESKLVCEIVKNIWNKLWSQYMSSSSDFEGLIGINQRVQQVLSLLCLDAMDSRIVGIWGMGGIGKTTIADVVFKLISGQFECHCFIQNVREKSKDGVGLEGLQGKVLSKLLDEEDLKVGTPNIPPFIKEKLNWKKVLIVLDDVNDSIKLETLVGGRGLNRFGLGSRIILTSRDRQVLRSCGVNDHNICEVEGLNRDEALELFCNYAFKQKGPTKNIMELSEKLVHYARGNPLALKVLGSCLYGKDKPVWESALNKLQATLTSGGVFDVLKISYDGLNDEEKELFLDIACFFNDYRHNAYITDVDCKYPLSVLNDKSLITTDGEIYMHELLVEMGREIVRKESPKKPGGRSRLWKHEDVINTLKNDKGTYKVEGIYLWEPCENIDIHLSCQAFDKMINLRFLILANCFGRRTFKLHLPNGLNYLSNELRILRWDGYPLNMLPSNFDPEKLVELVLFYSNIEQLWEGSKHAPKLKLLILSGCPHLSKIPNLLDFPLLEHVYLQSCNSLLEFPSSVQHLNLLSLKLNDCINVTKFPLVSENIEYLYLRGTAIKEVSSSIQSLIKLKRLDMSECTELNSISTSICELKFLEFLNLHKTAIKELPPSIEHLNALGELILSSCTNLEKLPAKLGNLKSLKRLIVRGSAVSQLPTCLENLEELDCSGCGGLNRLPPLSGLCSLRKLDFHKCNLMEIPEDIGCLSSLHWLRLSGNMFEGLPRSIKQLSNLRILHLQDCNMLRSVTELPLGLHRLDATSCKQLCQALPDASEFVRLNTNRSTTSGILTLEFANCQKLNHKEVGNVIGESLRLMQQNTEKVTSLLNLNTLFPLLSLPLQITIVFMLQRPPTKVDIIFPGSEIPEWFSYQNAGPSINIQVLGHNLVNRKYMGFAVCAVIGLDSEKFFIDRGGLIVDFYLEKSDGEREKKGRDCFSIENRISLDSDHIILGYSLFSKFDLFRLDNIFANPNDNVNMSFEFEAHTMFGSKGFKVKYCAIHPIFEEPIKTCGERKHGRCNDDEEVEQHPKKICRED